MVFEKRFGALDWIDVYQYKEMRSAIVYTAMNLWFT
jgi:hypothetical protein